MKESKKERKKERRRIMWLIISLVFNVAVFMQMEEKDGTEERI